MVVSAISSTGAATSLVMAPPGELAASPHACEAARAANRLQECAGIEFSVIDGDTGDPLHLADDHRLLDWSSRAELCREVARRGQPEIIEDEEPWLLLAVPLIRGDETLVAVAPLLTRPATRRDTARLADNLGLDADVAAEWAARQEPLPADAALRLATVTAAKLAADDEVEQLEEEVEKLSAHLGSTFEEISLIYRLTQNLKLSSNDEDLGRRALEWLSEVVPAEGLALLLIPGSEVGHAAPEARTQPLLLTRGHCPLQIEAFLELIEQLKLRANNRPLVVNHLAQVTPGARFAAVRELVIVPVAEGEHLFGWLAAINHDRSGEFGSAEASLLSSVGTMLGIHSGNIDLYRQQAELLTGVVRAMSSAIDAKDPYTRGHSDRVARIAVRLAKELNCDAETIKTIYFSGLLHDIGKIGINDEVLRKPGKLTDEEFEHIKTHVLIGYRILADLRKLSHMLPVVLHHHESWDGTGYPHGLAAEGIPYLARIVAVADAYDAMASDRPYRAGMEDEKLDAIIRKGAGQQWDPQVVEAFFRARDDIRAISSRGALSAEAAEPNWT